MTMRASPFVIVLGLLGGLAGDVGCLIQPKDADCTGATTCDACSDREGCGWCIGTGSCQPGTSLGPTSGTCAGWRFATCEGPDPDNCRDRDSCDSCGNPLQTCAWCLSSNTCQPTGDPCTGAVVTDRETCGATICNPLGSCGACISSRESCYWCTLSGQCRDDLGQCPRYEYVTSYSGVCR